MKNSYIDLHTHTLHSDGALTPQQLLQKAKEYGLVALAITDHDSIESYDQQTLALAKNLGIELVPGIEFSTRDNEGTKYHILGLFVDLRNPQLKALTKVLKTQRQQYSLKVCEVLNQNGWKIDTAKLLTHSGTVTKGHIAKTVLRNPENIAKLKRIFGGRLPSMGEFIEKVMIKGCSCFVKHDEILTPQEAIDIIHKAHGIAILAHPSFNIIKGESSQKLCSKFKKMGIDGFEAIYIEYDRSHNDAEIQHIKELTQYAREHDLTITGGSDYHCSDDQTVGKFIDLGFANHAIKVPYGILEDLKIFGKKKYRSFKAN